MMKKTLMLMYLSVILVYSQSAYAEGVSGRAFNTFIYSDLVTESTTVMTFETNANLLIDAYKGFCLFSGRVSSKIASS